MAATTARSAAALIAAGERLSLFSPAQPRPWTHRPCPPTAHERNGIIRVATTLTATLALAFALATAASAQTAPPTQQHLTPAASKLRVSLYRTEPCLSRIIDLEDPTWDPTVDYGGGHGNTADSYGLPQGNPGTKMAYYSYTVGRHKPGDPTGSDWATDPLTQIAWMRNYAIGKYGSECAAWSWRSTHPSY